MVRRKLTPRTQIEPHPGDKRFIRRIAKGQPGAGQIAKSVDLHRSLKDDDRRQAKRTTKEGQGDRGDEHRKTRKSR